MGTYNKPKMEKSKINILELRDSPWLDGPGRTILETGSRINPLKYGYYIGAFCKRYEEDHPFVRAVQKQGLYVFRINESNRFDRSVIAQVRRLIEKEKIDIVHTHEVRSDIIGLIVGKLSGVPVMTTLHGWIDNGFRGKVLTRLDKCILRFFDHVISVSEKMKKQVLNYGVRQDKMTILHNALVLENYQPNSADKAFRRELEISDTTLLIGNIGRLSPEKGQLDFIKAAATVLKEHQNTKFVLIGKGDEEHQLRRLVKNLGIEKEIIFLGYRSDMFNVYNSLDLVVQSSYTEGMPNVILEALAMKVPVIATDVGGTSEAVINDETGILIQPGKPEKLSQKILEFINNKDIFKKMTEKGRKLVECKFNIEERTKKLSLIYDRLIYEKRKSP